VWQDGGACCGGGGSASRTRGRSKALPSPYPEKVRSVKEHAIFLNFSLHSVRFKFDKLKKMQDIIKKHQNVFFKKIMSGQINPTQPFKIFCAP
jgi:hypothetical protein